MSCFIAVINLDGAPVDVDLLRRLTQTMAWRGPDAQDIQTLDAAGLGSALLRTTFEAEREHQPCTLDRRVWIAADCRIDARDELIQDLESRGRNAVREATDPELILHAWAVWGEDCVSHLLGDFSFAIWDAADRKLFCARDQMGIRLLYYARTPACLIVSNSLQAIRRHPAISGKLNELAIADFLMFGSNQDLSTTTFDGIHRLRAAHRMSAVAGELRIDRYWQMPIDPPLRLPRRRDYVEHFLELMRTVMRDRLRCEKAAVMMSGGLDSTGIAAIAQEVLGKSGHVRAYTSVYDSLIPDRERYYAGLVARHLDIPIRFRTDDENRLFEVFPDADLRRIPDPVFIPAFGPDSRQDGLLAMAVADGARVAFHGEGGDDALFYEWKPYLKFELARGHFASLLRDAVSFPFLFGRLPISRKKNEKSRIPGYVEECPAWFRPEFAARLGLDERYREIRAQVTALPHPARPSGYSKGFAPAGWQFLAENYDPEVTGLPIEVRHPYLDLRMLRYLLSVPVIPWCRNKYLLRRAFSRYLPAEVIERPKKGMSGFPTFESWKLYGIPQNLPREVAAEYVNFEVLEPLVIDSPQSLGDSLRPFALGIFLAQRRSEML